MAPEKRNRGTFPGHRLKFPAKVVQTLPQHILPAELARLLGISRAAISKWMRCGGLPVSTVLCRNSAILALAVAQACLTAAARRFLTLKE